MSPDDFLFVSPPKTGTRFFNDTVCKINGIPCVFHDNFKSVEVEGWGSWDDPSLLHEKKTLPPYGPMLSEDTKVISIVRNPYDLLVSYFHHNYGPLHMGWANVRNIHKLHTFDQFIERYCSDEAWHFPTLKENLFAPMYNDGKLISNIIFRFERLTIDIAEFCYDYNFLNTGTRYNYDSKFRQGIHYKAFYSDRLRKLVYPKIEKLLDEFKYTF